MIDLKTILQKHPNCLSSRISFKSILLDMYPDERRTINIMLSMYESGVVRKIQGKQVLLQADIESILSFLENEYGISVKYAKEAVSIWATAFDVPIQDTIAFQPVIGSKSNTAIPEGQPYVRQTRSRSVRDYGNISTDTLGNSQQSTNYSIIGYSLEWETLVLPSGGLMITRFVGVDDAEVIVPNNINGIIVSTIGSKTFYQCIGIKRIVVSEGIVEIQDGAFSGCEALTSVYLPSTLKKLGSNEKIVQEGVFENTGLEEIIIPKGLTYIATKAFKRCQKLKKVEIPDGVTEVCAEAFLGCVRLGKIFLPDDLTIIGENAFSKTIIEDIYIPDGICEISNYTFYKCTSLKNVSLPDSIEKIGEYAFARSGLVSIYVPDKTLSIGNYAFSQCKKLQNISLSENLQTIGENAFSQTAVANMKIPGSVSTIAQNVFLNCDKLSTVILYEGIVEIEEFAFENCKELREITIPMSVQKIGINAFKLNAGWYDGKTKNKNLIIACFPSSVALEYARKNSYKTKAATYANI